MLPGLFFLIWRSFEIWTLIPVIGMLSWFVHGYTVNDQLTPTTILVLFIVSVLACFWAVATLLAYQTTKYNAGFCAFVDLCFVGALIAGVYYLRGITDVNCSSIGVGENNFFLGLGIFGSISGDVNSPYIHIDKNCAMLKASFAFGIMNIIFFFVTCLILLWVHREHGDGGVYYSRRTRRRSRSPRHYSSSPRSRSHRSSHYSRRTYV